MPYSTRNRIELQTTGSNTNVWGDRLNAGGFELIDFALDGMTTKALTGAYTLTSANGVADEARSRMLKFTGTGAFTVTIPSVEKFYVVWNTCSGNVTLGVGAGTSAVVGSGEIAIVVCDGSNTTRTGRLTGVAMPQDANDAASKAYVDAQVWASQTGILPGQTGSAGKFLTTDGTVASWEAPTVSEISDYASDQATREEALKAFAIAAATVL